MKTLTTEIKQAIFNNVFKRYERECKETYSTPKAALRNKVRGYSFRQHFEDTHLLKQHNIEITDYEITQDNIRIAKLDFTYGKKSRTTLCGKCTGFTINYLEENK